MEFLHFLEEIRTPFGDFIFSNITRLGEEAFFILIGLLFFWCINKREGYYLLSIGLIGTILNQFLKLIFRIPRPWVRDESFTIVESARGEATGYSFPSGHTQSSVGIFGGIARSNKQKYLRFLCIALCILVPFSRMYLGVHTPIDVCVSAILALALIFLLYPVIRKSMNNNKIMRILFASMTAFAVVFLIFVSVYPFPADVDVSNLEHGTKNAYKMLGCMLGLWLSFEVDERYTQFETKAVWWAQILKLFIGIIPIVIVKSALKEPLYMIIPNQYIADTIRYFLLTVVAGCLWPLTFKWFSRFSSAK
ncbi:MAG: phosphatase PAP2 family protein [Oscillospiraceae bacterium]|nr:phosphatase PAP2 family protein [Oscillospiraceae bacterium]